MRTMQIPQNPVSGGRRRNPLRRLTAVNGGRYSLIRKSKYWEFEASAGNQSLKAAAARIVQARAAVRANAADLLPNVSSGANGSRSAPNPATFASSPYTLYTTQASASYEPDLFGRIRDNDRAIAFDAETTQAAYRSVLLSLQADVAQDYFLIRALDDERLLLGNR